MKTEIVSAIISYLISALLQCVTIFPKKFFFALHQRVFQSQTDHWRSKAWLFVFGLVFVFIAFASYFSISFFFFQNDSRNRIILLLPSGAQAQNVRQDAEMQFLGLFDYMSKLTPIKAQEVEVVPRSNDFNSIEARTIVAEEMKRGSRFFVVTMSQISKDLAEEWDSICLKYSNKEECYLIATVASAPNIASKKDNVFRFYIRSEEEGRRLAGIGQNNGLKSAASICVDDEYGKEASKAFINSWGGSPEKIQNLLIPVGSDEDRYYKIISNLVNNPEGKPDCIFIANYGNGLARTIKALDKHKFYPFLLLTSTFSIEEWRKPIGSILSNFDDWKTLQPSYRNSGSQFNNVVRNFTCFTLLRVHEAIMKSKKESKAFSDIWKSQEVLPSFGLDLEFLPDGDCSIVVEEYKNKFNSENRNKY